MHSTRNDINIVLSILHTCGYIFGTAPYSRKLKENGFNFSKNKNVLPLVIHVSMFIILQTMLFQFSDMKWHDSKTNKIYTVIAISKQTNQIIGMSMGWKYQSQFLEAFYNIFCIYRMKPTDSIGEKKILNIKMYIITCYLFAVTGFIGVLIFLLTNKNVSFSNLATYLFHCSEFQYNSSVVINLTTFVLLVLLIIGDILNDIKSCETTDSIYRIGTIYGLIYKGTKLITKPFGIYIPTAIVIDLCNIIFVIATRRNYIQICKVILDIVYLSMLLYCAGSLNTAHKRISTALSKIQNGKENLDFANAKNIVLLQIAQEEIQLTAGGCFPLSFRDFTEQAGVCISIILFLIQILD